MKASKHTYEPRGMDSGANTVEAALLKQLPLRQVAAMMKTDGVSDTPNDRLVTAETVSDMIGVHTGTLRVWRERTRDTGKLIGLPWTVVKVERFNFIGYLLSDVRRFFETYVQRIDPHLLDGETAKAWAEGFDAEMERLEAEEQAKAKREEATSFNAFSGSSPPASNGQGGAQ